MEMLDFLLKARRFAFIYKLIAPAVRILWKRADALVANSIGLKEMAERFYDKKQILVIPNGATICEGVISQASQKEAEDSLVRLLFVSRLIKRKGLQDFLPQLRKVVDLCSKGSKRVILDVVGDGPFRSTLEDIVVKHGLKDVVLFHGQKEKTDLSFYYEQADIFIFPSHKEGMPNAVLEAMSYGLPIIMTPCEGSTEQITNNGMICPIDDFSKNVTELVLDGDRRRKMGRRSHELVRDQFSWANTARQYDDIFRTLSK